MGLVQELGGRRGAALAVALAATGAFFVELQRPVPCDDAYITFRHVRNFIDSGRPAWNLHGAPVLGSTSPAYLFLLSACSWLSRSTNVESVALHLNAALQFGIVILSFLIGRDLTGRTILAGCIALLIGINSVNVLVFSQGFASPMLTLTVLASCYLVRTGRPSAALTFASIAPLIRPDGILVCLIVCAAIVIRRRVEWRMIAAVLTLPLSWLVFSICYYGTPIPHSLIAIGRFPMMHFPYARESVDLVSRIPGAFTGAWRLWSGTAGPLLISGTIQPDSALPGSSFRLVVVAVGYLSALGFLIRRRDARLIYLLMTPAFLLLFGWLGHTKPWYFPPFVTCSVIAAFAGWAMIADRLSTTLHRFGVRVSGWSTRVLLALVVLVFVSANHYSINTGQFGYENRAIVHPPHPWGSLWDAWELGRYRQYRLAAELLNRRFRPDQTVLISEVGVFGYYYKGEVVDVMGLCSPEALTFYPPPQSDIFNDSGQPYSNAGATTPAAMVDVLAPDFVVNSRTYIANLLQEGAPLTRDYTEIARFGLVWGEPLLVFERVNPVRRNRRRRGPLSRPRKT